MSGAASDSAPAGQNRSGVAASGFDAFISYAHGDREFAARLRGALEELGKSVWMDEDGIPGGGRWKAELERAIESSHAFLFLASSASAASSECARELEYAVGLNKRILPVRAESTEPRGLPERLSEYQLIPAREVFTDDFDGSLKLLIGAIDSDPEWVHQHTEWGRRALEWDRQGRNQGFLLAGAALEAAERWRREAPGKQPAPSLLQGEYIDASRQAVTRRLRQTRAVIAGALLVAVALGVLAFVQRQIAVSNEHTAQSLRLAASADATLAQDPELSTLLALHALRTRETPQAVQALRNALPQLNVLATLRAGAAVNGATFSPDGSEIMTASMDGSVRIWSASTHKQLAVLVKPGATPVYDASFSPDGREIAAASGDASGGHGMARIWSARTHRELAVFREPPIRITNGLNSAEFSPDGSQLVTASADGTARIWSARSHRELRVLAEPGSDSISWAAFSPNGKQVVTSSDDGTARVWDAATGRQLLLLAGHTQAVGHAVFSPDGSQILTASNDGTATLWSATGHEQLAVLTEPTGQQMENAAFSPDGEQIVTSNHDGTARVWSAGTQKQLAVLVKPGAAHVYDAVFSPDVKQIVTASSERTARVWSASTHRQLAVLTHRLTVWSAGFSPDGKQIVTASDDGTARIWSATTYKQLAVLTEPAGSPNPNGHGLNSAFFSPDGKEIVTASSDDTARIWSANTHRQLAVLTEPASNTALNAVFSPDGKQILITAGDGTAQIWSARTDKQLAVLSEPGGSSITDAVFSPDGKLIVTTSAHGIVRFWSASDHRQLAVLTEPGAFPLYNVAFNSDGRKIVTASGDDTARVWSTEIAGPISAIERLAATRVTRQLTPRERATYLGG